MIYDRYYYSKLNNREKKAYKKIYAAMQNYEPFVTIDGFFETDIPKLMSAINFDNPHLFFVDFHYELQSNLFSQTIKLKYIYNQADTVVLTEKVKKVCNKILSKVTGKTEFEKELSLHDVLARNVLYDDVAKDNLLKFHARSNTILGVLFYKSAVCEGIAKTLKFLLNALDIKCVVVKGKATDELSGGIVSPEIFHAWNMVKIDEKPYYVDLTWDINLSEKNIIRHDYFNLTDMDIAIDHSIDKNLPSCKAYDDNYFYKNGLVVTKKADLRRIVANKINNGENSVEFKIMNEVIDKNSDMFDIFKSCIRLAVGNECCFTLYGTEKSKQGVYCFEWKIK